MGKGLLAERRRGLLGEGTARPPPEDTLTLWDMVLLDAMSAWCWLLW